MNHKEGLTALMEEQLGDIVLSASSPEGVVNRSVLKRSNRTLVNRFLHPIRILTASTLAVLPTLPGGSVFLAHAQENSYPINLTPTRLTNTLLDQPSPKKEEFSLISQPPAQTLNQTLAVETERLADGGEWASLEEVQQRGFTGVGFQAIARMIPAVVGKAISPEIPRPNGDVIQQTESGLMAWRKADNWTAFTDGSRTWVNGPVGLQERGNKERFGWEEDSQNNGSSFDNKANQQDNELYLGKYKVVNTLEQTVDGKRYTIQTLVSPTASHSVIINPTAEENLRKFIAEEGKRNGFYNVRIIVLGRDEGVEGVWMGWEGYRVGSKYERIGFYGSQRLGVDVNLFYGTDPTSPFDNPYFMQNGVRATLGARFVTVSVTGGSLVTNSMSPLGPPPTPEQWTRILSAAGWSREAFDLIPYSSK